MTSIRRALISVFDKSGLQDLARFLADRSIQILSTGGTAQALRNCGIEVTDVSAYTGFPEMLDGRVKTLHPKIHGGLLQLRDNQNHLRQAAAHGIEQIDLVVVNLYPFEQTIRRQDVTDEEAIEQIDIGGPSMLRSAAKNHRFVTVVTDPADYGTVRDEIAAHGGTTPETRRLLAAKVFGQTAYYDRLIAAYLSRGTSADPFPEAGGLLARKAKELRYGENPHQKAALYGSFLDSFRQIHGKELSYNNILDISSASGLIAEFDAPTLAILKHTNPCGVAASESLLTAWELALETDRQAPFGGIIIVNRELDAATARAIAEIFSEVIIAPNFSAEALEILTQKKNLRLMENRFIPPSQGMDLRSAPGGFLIQESDATHDDPARWKAVTERSPSAEEMRAMEFGWKVVKHVKSNAIVYCGANRTLGVGAGQMSRVDASKIAVWKAGQAGLSLEGSAVASDAFFPFADGVEAAAEAGATAVIQPGGSVRDKEVIAAANQRGLAMVFTGRRHFRH